MTFCDGPRHLCLVVCLLLLQLCTLTASRATGFTPQVPQNPCPDMKNHIMGSKCVIGSKTGSQGDLDMAAWEALVENACQVLCLDGLYRHQVFHLREDMIAYRHIDATAALRVLALDDNTELYNTTFYVTASNVRFEGLNSVDSALLVGPREDSVQIINCIFNVAPTSGTEATAPALAGGAVIRYQAGGSDSAIVGCQFNGLVGDMGFYTNGSNSSAEWGADLPIDVDPAKHKYLTSIAIIGQINFLLNSTSFIFFSKILVKSSTNMRILHSTVVETFVRFVNPTTRLSVRHSVFRSEIIGSYGFTGRPDEKPVMQKPCLVKFCSPLLTSPPSLGLVATRGDVARDVGMGSNMTRDVTTSLDSYQSTSGGTDDDDTNYFQSFGQKGNSSSSEFQQEKREALQVDLLPLVVPEPEELLFDPCGSPNASQQADAVALKVNDSATATGLLWERSTIDVSGNLAALSLRNLQCSFVQTLSRRGAWESRFIVLSGELDTTHGNVFAYDVVGDVEVMLDRKSDGKEEKEQRLVPKEYSQPVLRKYGIAYMHAIDNDGNRIGADAVGIGLDTTDANDECRMDLASFASRVNGPVPSRGASLSEGSVAIGIVVSCAVGTTALVIYMCLKGECRRSVLVGEEDAIAAVKGETNDRRGLTPPSGNAASQPLPISGVEHSRAAESHAESPAFISINRDQQAIIGQSTAGLQTWGRTVGGPSLPNAATNLSVLCSTFDSREEAIANNSATSASFVEPLARLTSPQNGNKSAPVVFRRGVPTVATNSSGAADRSNCDTFRSSMFSQSSEDEDDTEMS